MQRYIKELKPSNLGDIAAMIALYRPGPMEHIDRFIRSKHGREQVTYPHPSMKDLLDETYGVIVYQDQVLQILQNFAGYTLGEADTVRKAMGKKIPALMAEERSRFVTGAVEQGYTEQMGSEIFNLIEPFAGYAFNKAHSVSYALISYWTGYFKAHYPVEYMAAVLNSRLDNTERMISSINECFRLGIGVHLPDINRSGEFFTIDYGQDKPGLRIGLAAIKTVGEGAVRPLVEERNENGPYESIDDFCSRAGGSGLNRRTLESMVKAGAFDNLASRGAMLEALDRIVATAQREAQNRSSGQSSLFGGAIAETEPAPGIGLGSNDVSGEQKAAWERELVGVALSYNPLVSLSALSADGGAGDALTSIGQLSEELQGQSVTLLGIVSTTTERSTKEGKRFFIVELDLLGGPLEVMVWPDTLTRTADVWQDGRMVRVAGKIRLRGDQMSLACDDAEEYVAEQPSQLSPAASNGNGGNGGGRRNGQNGYTNGNGYNNGGGNGNGYQSHGNGGGGGTGGVAQEAPSGGGYTPAGSNRVVNLGVSETDDPAQDALLLREVIGVILEYPGRDRVNLEIRTLGKKVLMDLPVVSTGYCPSLHERLEDLLGPDTVTVHQEMPLAVD
jgi:DNA polymerase-3 subunit alpha